VASPGAKSAVSDCILLILNLVFPFKLYGHGSLSTFVCLIVYFGKFACEHESWKLLIIRL